MDGISARCVSLVRSLWRSRPHFADLAFGTLAMALGASFLYAPLGRDQGAFIYIGREWLHGRLPYRDSFDMKPPAIHALYALSLAPRPSREWHPSLASMSRSAETGAETSGIEVAGGSAGGG